MRITRGSRIEGGGGGGGCSHYLYPYCLLSINTIPPVPAPAAPCSDTTGVGSFKAYCNHHINWRHQNESTLIHSSTRASSDVIEFKSTRKSTSELNTAHHNEISIRDSEEEDEVRRSKREKSGVGVKKERACLWSLHLCWQRQQHRSGPLPHPPFEGEGAVKRWRVCVCVYSFLNTMYTLILFIFKIDWRVHCVGIKPIGRV